jgi:hypothetical protein
MSDDKPEDAPVSDHTPDTPPVTHEPSPATPDTDKDDIREVVRKLEETVNGLAEQVALITPDPHDSTPTKRPWTHRGQR